MKKYPNIIFIALLVLMSCRNQNQNLTADIEIPVSVEEVSLKPIEELVSTTGTVFPKGEIELKSRIAAEYYPENNPRTGRVWQMGDRIMAGEVIARLEDREYVNSVKLETTKLNLELMESELKKQESLYEKGGVTLKELKTASINYENARTNLETAKLQMEKMKVVSPIDGVIVDLPYYTRGTQIETGLLICKIMDYKVMYMDVQLPEKYISSIKQGQPVKLTNYNLPGDTITGQITQLSPAINADTRTFKGNISVENQDYLLRPGMFVNADIIISRKDSAVVIPRDIILSRQKGKTIFVIDRGVASERIIETGLENMSDVEVVRGLSEKERVVTSGFETLGDRSKVKIVK